MSRGGDLLRLQEIDARLEHDRARLAELEALIAADPELERARREVRRLRRLQAAADSELAAAEAEADGFRGRARDLDRLLYGGSVRNPQELLAMEDDLAALRRRIVTHDDASLALMERAEASATALRAAERDLDERERQRTARAADLTASADGAREALAQHEREREDLLRTMEASDLGLYQRLARRLRPAVVRVTGDSCGGCHMPFAGSEVRRIRTADGPVQCSECDRLVVP